MELSATSKNKSERARQISRAKQDIVNDCLRGLIIFPYHEHHSSVHFVDAASVALLCGSIGADDQYRGAVGQCSPAEAEATCQSQDATSNRRNSNEMKIQDALSQLSKRQRLAQAESLIRHAALGARLLDVGEPAMGHIDEYKYSTFNRQLEHLRKLDRVMSLAETTTKKEVAAAAQAVESLMVDDYKTPSTYHEATSESNPDRDKWLASMARERNTLLERQTWEMFPRKSIGN